MKILLKKHSENGSEEENEKDEEDEKNADELVLDRSHVFI
jgi:hypothetical protein